MATLLYRLGSIAARRRWAFLIAWIVLLLGVGAAAAAFSGTMTSSFTIPGTPAQAALDELGERIPGAGDATGRIVFAAPEGHTLAEPAYQQAIATVVQEAQALPGVTGVIDPMTGRTVSPDMTVGFAQASFAGQITEIPESTQAALADVAAANQVDGLQIHLGGGAVPQAPAIGSTEGIGVIVAMVVLLLTFGSVVAAGLPMLTALIGVGTGLAGILWASAAIEMSNTAPILALMLGLAVGIDYALFIVSRHRAQVRAGMPVAESIARATGTAGTAVVFAGLTVLIALAGLSVVGIPFLTVMGLAAAATVAISVLIAITLLPALLAFAGERVLRRRDRGAAAAERARLDGQAVVIDHAATPNRWIRMITRRPVLVLVTGIAALAALTIPTWSLHLGLPDDGTAAPDSTRRQAYDLVTDSFGPGVNGPLLVTVSVDDPSTLQSAMTATAEAVQTGSSDVALVAPGPVSQDGTFGVLTVIPASGPSEEATQDLVHDLRDRAPELGAAVGGTIAVTGLTAAGIDISEKLAAALPIYLLLVVGLALVLLLADLPVDRRPGDRDAGLPALHRRGIRRRGRGLPVGLARRAVRRGHAGADHQLPADPADRRAVRAGDGLPGVPGVRHARGLRARRRATPRRGERLQRGLPGGDGGGDHHGVGVRGIHPRARHDHRVDRVRPRDRRARRRVRGPDDAHPGGDDAVEPARPGTCRAGSTGSCPTSTSRARNSPPAWPRRPRRAGGTGRQRNSNRRPGNPRAASRRQRAPVGTRPSEGRRP